MWHKIVEGKVGIGCNGVEVKGVDSKTTRLHPINQDYSHDELAARLVNIDAGWLYKKKPLFSPQGAHSDIWYEESVHLILTLANFSR